jgi:integrase
MVEAMDVPRDLSSFVVPCRGSLEATGDLFEPYRLVDAAGGVVGSVAGYLRDLQASGRSPVTQRCYGMDLLRWFRFLWSIDVRWDRATQVEARDFCCWIQATDKAVRPHWRQADQNPASAVTTARPVAVGGVRRAGVPNAVTGKPTPGLKYASSTVAHCETVLRSFYAYHLDAGSGPIVNPFPLVRGRRAGRPSAHGNPMDPALAQRSGRYRPRVPVRIPRAIPDEKFDELFAALGSHRDRALVAFWVSTGARAAELLGATHADADPGQQLITVIRKGSRCLQQLPASPDAFVWLRLYQAQLQGEAPTGADHPLWLTLRKPLRALTYHAARAMFGRANALLGSNWSLHDLRHSAAYRMARDPQMTLTDVQWVLGHAHLSTTQVYLTAPVEDMIAAVVAHHARRAQRPESPLADADRLHYRQQSLDVLFGQGPA